MLLLAHAVSGSDVDRSVYSLLSREMGFDPGVFGRFDLAASVQPHLKFLFVCL